MIKHKNKFLILYFLLIFSSFLILNIIRPALLIDEPWTFTNALNIKHGLLIYKDFNSVVTPFFYYLLVIPLLFFENILSIRVFASLLLFFGVVVFYSTLKKLKFHFCERIIYTLFFSFLIYIQCFDYNLLNQILLLVGFYFCLQEKNNRNIILLGNIIALMILTKQTTGFLFGVVLIFIYKLLHKITKKDFLKIIAVLFVYFSIFLIWLLLCDNLKYFIDYTILGIQEFKNQISFLEFLKTNTIALASIVFYIILYIKAILVYKKTKNNILLSIFLLNVINLTLLYPICNMGHLTFTFLYSFLLLIELLKLSNKRIKDKKHNYIRFFLLLVLYLTFQICIIFTFKESTIKIQDGYYQYSYVDKKEYQSYQPIIKYIKEHKENSYYSIEECSSFVSLHTNNVNNGKIGLFLKGNIGTNDYIEIIKELEDNKHYIYLYQNDTLEFWQIPHGVREYIKASYKKIDSVKNFDIYQLKKD